MYRQNRFPSLCELSAILILDLHKSFHKCKPDVALSHDRLPML